MTDFLLVQTPLKEMVSTNKKQNKQSNNNFISMTYEEITNKFIGGSANWGLNSTLTHYGNNRQPTPVLRRYARSASVHRRFNPGCPLC